MSTRASPTAWTPALIVPIVVEALPIYSSIYAKSLAASEYGIWQFPFSWYTNLGLQSYVPTTESRFSYGRPDPLPGSRPFRIDPNTGGSGFTGILLRWALPDGLTRGTQANQGGARAAVASSSQVNFPPMPNRWLVLRTYVASPGAAPQWRGWVVISDGIGDPAKGDGASFPSAAMDGAPMRIGTVVPLESWLANGGAAGTTLSTPLTAVGFGEAAFAAAVPLSHGICSLADDLSDLPNAQPLDVSYCVAGWYADPVHDPLNTSDAKAWVDAMTSLAWAGPEGGLTGPAMTAALQAAANWAAAHGITMNGPAPSMAPLPTRTLCHGMTLQVQWQGPGASQQQPKEAKIAPGTRPLVAAGSSAIDAMSAILTHLVAPTSPDPDLVAASIAACLLGIESLLDEVDGRAQTALALHASRFQSLPGGVRWSLVPSPSARIPPTPPAPIPLAPLVPPESEIIAVYRPALAVINAAQRRLDAGSLALTLAQWHWYAQWAKLQLANIDQDQSFAAACQITLQVCQARCAPLQEAVSQASQDVIRAKAAFENLPPTLTLTPMARDPYVRPNDPVVMVFGIGRAAAHGHDTAATDTDTLPCRLTGQTLDGYRSAQVQTVVANAAVPSIPAGAALPLEIADLALEFAMLDPSMASTLAGPGTTASALQGFENDQSAAGAAGVWPPGATLLPFTSQDGAMTLPWNIAALEWVAPWSPLLLDWQASVWPVSGTAEQASLLHWKPPTWSGFSVDAGPAWTPVDGPPDPSSGAQDYVGRSVLTPYAADLLLNRVASLPADLRPSQQVLDQMRLSPVLSQALSGFCDALLMRDPSVALAASTTAGDNLPPVSPPSPFKAMPTMLATFQPLRAGWMRPSRLWVLDAFGQTVDLVTASGADGNAISPWVASESAPFPGVGPSPVLLRPRLAQWARLDFDLLSADGDAVAADCAAPCVCGWLLMDWVDDAWAVYDEAGVYRGSVSCINGAWSPAPDLTPAGTSAALLLPNRHLANLVALLCQPGQAAQLSAYAQSASWSAPATGTGPAGLLHAMVGAPLAVVRASLGIDLPGPEYDESVTATKTATQSNGSPSWPPQTQGVEQLPFTVLLGTYELLDDGLVAFTNDGTPGMGSPYATTPTAVEVSAATPLTMTLVLDPARSVLAVSDCFPAKRLTLPADRRQAPTAEMELLFRFAPVLSEPARVTVPIPAVGAAAGTWTWLEYASSGEPALPQPAYHADTFAVLGAAPALAHSGWLRLTTSTQPTVLTYVVTPAALPCGAPATLIVSILNSTTQPAVVDSITLQLPAALVPPGGSAAVSVMAETKGTGVSAPRAGPGGSVVVTVQVPTPAGPGLVSTLRASGLVAPGAPGKADVVIIEVAPAADGSHSLSETTNCFVEWQQDKSRIE
jgi:hypothetical protein